LITRLIADLLGAQDPDKPHTWLTRVLVSLIIVAGNLVYFGFFGVLGLVAVYLVGVELMGIDLRWLYAPVGLAILVGLKQSYSGITDYWRHYGHG
jgi:hypothetical protein